MNTNKFYEFFQPEKYPDRIHIIGCGAVGSTIAELLIRMGFTKFTLYDFDTVEEHNIANQMFREHDIGKPKTEALRDIMSEINSEADIKIEEKYLGQSLNGYVFLAVDRITLRKSICETNLYNSAIKAVFDTRIRLTDAQGFAARWDDYNEKQNLLKSMNFTDEEADAETPTTACNLALSVAPTVRIICNCVVCNFINLLLNKQENFKRIMLIDAFDHMLSTF